MNILKNKHLIFLGSSVTYGEAAGGYSFVDALADRSGCIVIKEAVSGTTLVDDAADSYVARLKQIPDMQNADLFLCQLSTNDASQGKTLGSFSDAENTKTILGAIKHIVVYAKETWHCPVAFFTNPRYESEQYEIMVKAIHQAKREWNFSVIDLWNDRAFNNITSDERRRFMADQVHPTREGYIRWWAPYFELQIEAILKKHQSLD